MDLRCTAFATFPVADRETSAARSRPTVGIDPSPSQCPVSRETQRAARLNDSCGEGFRTPARHCASFVRRRRPEPFTILDIALRSPQFLKRTCASSAQEVPWKDS
jgi:hypothetical protein